MDGWHLAPQLSPTMRCCTLQRPRVLGICTEFFHRACINATGNLLSIDPASSLMRWRQTDESSISLPIASDATPGECAAQQCGLVSSLQEGTSVRACKCIQKLPCRSPQSIASACTIALQCLGICLGQNPASRDLHVGLG